MANIIKTQHSKHSVMFRRQGDVSPIYNRSFFANPRIPAVTTASPLDIKGITGWSPLSSKLVLHSPGFTSVSTLSTCSINDMAKTSEIPDSPLPRTPEEDQETMDSPEHDSCFSPSPNNFAFGGPLLSLNTLLDTSMASSGCSSLPPFTNEGSLCGDSDRSHASSGLELNFADCLTDELESPSSDNQCHEDSTQNKSACHIFSSEKSPVANCHALPESKGSPKRKLHNKNRKSSSNKKLTNKSASSISQNGIKPVLDKIESVEVVQKSSIPSVKKEVKVVAVEPPLSECPSADDLFQVVVSRKDKYKNRNTKPVLADEATGSHYSAKSSNTNKKSKSWIAPRPSCSRPNQSITPTSSSTKSISIHEKMNQSDATETAHSHRQDVINSGATRLASASMPNGCQRIKKTPGSAKTKPLHNSSSTPLPSISLNPPTSTNAPTRSQAVCPWRNLSSNDAKNAKLSSSSDKSQPDASIKFMYHLWQKFMSDFNTLQATNPSMVDVF